MPPGYPNSFATVCGNQSYGSGCAPNSTSGAPFFAPPATDYTLQAGDVWFFVPGTPLRPLSELQATYHATVGTGGFIELDFAIDRTGNVAPNHAALYAAFGAWRRACYSNPIASATMEPDGGSSLVLPLAADGASSVLLDRVVLAEDMAGLGQCVYGYSVEARPSPAAPWAPFSAALTVGNKRIDIVRALNASHLRVNVSADTMCPGNARGAVAVSAFSPIPCGVPPSTRVQYKYSDGRCLTVNTTRFPCAGITCPLFLGDCASAGAVWDDGGDQLSSWADGVATTVVNVDCNDCSTRAVVKLLAGTGSPANVTFAAGQLAYTCASSAPPAPLCFNDGQGTPMPACGGDPPYAGQVMVDVCGAPGTTGWSRVEV